MKTYPGLAKTHTPTPLPHEAMFTRERFPLRRTVLYVKQIHSFAQLAVFCSLLSFASPALAVEKKAVDLSEIFPDEAHSTLQTFNSNKTLTSDPTYRSLFEKCRGYDNNDPVCTGNATVFGIVNQLDANSSTRAMNRMVVIQPSGTRRIMDVDIRGGKVRYDPTSVTGNQIGLISVSYFRSAGTTKSPFVRCDAEMLICGPDVGICPQPLPAQCTPIVGATASTTTGTSNCTCASGKILESCFANVPVCKDPPPPVVCDDGYVIPPGGTTCVKSHDCSMYSSQLATVCSGRAQSYTSSDAYPENLTCSGTSTATECSSTGASCSMTLSLTRIQQPSSSTATDGGLTAVGNAGTGIVRYSLAPSGISSGPGIFDGLKAGSYTITATDSATPEACTKSVILALRADSSCTTAPLCSDRTYSDQHCPGANFFDGCGNQCSGTKTSGCAGVTCQETLVAYSGATDFQGMSGLAAGHLAESSVGTSNLGNRSYHETPYSTAGSLYANQPVTYSSDCGTNGSWTTTRTIGSPQGAGSCAGMVRPSTVTVGNQIVQLPTIDFSYGAATQCSRDDEPTWMDADSVGKETIYKTAKFYPWAKVTAGSACMNGTTTRGFVGQACMKSTGEAGVYEGIKYRACWGESFPDTDKYSWKCESTELEFCTCR